MPGAIADVDRMVAALRKHWSSRQGDLAGSESGPLVASINLNRRSKTAVSTSRRTIKADAASSVFSVDCSSLVWAILDAGVDARHPAFKARGGSGSRVTRTIDFTQVDIVALSQSLQRGESLVKALEPHVRVYGTTPRYSPPRSNHGTHVAGILAGSGPHEAREPVHGICPDINIWDLRVVDAVDGGGAGGVEDFGWEDRILLAMQYIQAVNAQDPRHLQVCGANLSLSIPYNPASDACGWTPVCKEARRLVRSGVVVVAAAGNAGFAASAGFRTAGAGYSILGITDPGNADDVITVGATHRLEPLRYGASYFSSKGPTADGRHKPDLLAPGENITSASGPNSTASKDGTSQAAPHVSGAAAMLLARNPELIGRPELVKQILCTTATDLGRERTFQGAGIVDVLRAMQSV
ncbi:S8 family serine peptidase [Nocardioides sp. W7]|uniref:S8 family serine peptidase n=1 Tax=Nocardioides sp. W7 TaxID=2931390 RepID=UPI001FD4C88A|nr:S8 family serine peptidase [Nocardioides sp. W7]